MKHLLSVIIALFLFSGCASYSVLYDLELSNVTTPEGEAPKSNFINQSGPQHDYAEELVHIRLTFTVNNIHIYVYNRSDKTITLPWDNVSYISADGTANRVIHSGVRYINKTAPQTPSIIPPESSLDDVMIPTDNIYYDGALGWMIHPIITTADVGSKIRVVLPFEFDGEPASYTLELDVMDVVVTKF